MLRKARWEAVLGWEKTGDKKAKLFKNSILVVILNSL